MEFKGKDHQFKCVPHVLGIKKEYDNYLLNVELAKTAGEDPPEEVKPVIITLTGVKQPELNEQAIREQEIASTYAITERLEKISEITLALVDKHFVGIEGLVIDGKEITNFNGFYESAPPELVQWVLMAVMSTEILTAAELKN